MIARVLFLLQQTNTFQKSGYDKTPPDMQLTKWSACVWCRSAFSSRSSVRCARSRRDRSGSNPPYLTPLVHYISRCRRLPPINLVQRETVKYLLALNFESLYFKDLTIRYANFRTKLPHTFENIFLTHFLCTVHKRTNSLHFYSKHFLFCYDP